MIDEKRLEGLRVLVYESFVLGPEPTAPAENLGPELIRLARLGLWAEKYGVPAIQDAVQAIEVPAQAFYEAKGVTATSVGLRQALAALPKGME
jgi:hypothetical protein